VGVLSLVCSLPGYIFCKSWFLHLGQLASGTASNLLDLKAGKLLLELLELLGKLSLVLGAQFVSLDSSLMKGVEKIVTKVEGQDPVSEIAKNHEPALC